MTARRPVALRGSLARRDCAGGTRVRLRVGSGATAAGASIRSGGRVKRPPLSEGRRDVARTREAARCNPINRGTSGWIGCTRSGSAGPAGDGTPNRVGEEAPSFVLTPSTVRRTSRQRRPSYSTATARQSVRSTWIAHSARPAGGDACAFKSFGGGGCFLFRDCCLSPQHNPVFIAWPIVPVAEFVAAGSRTGASVLTPTTRVRFAQSRLSHR